MHTGNIWMKFGFVGIVVLGLIGGSASTALADIEAVVSVEFLEDSGGEMTETVITEIDTGDPFWMRVSVDSPIGEPLIELAKGYIDVTVSHSSTEFTFDKNIWTINTNDLPPHYINELLPYFRTNFGRSILQDSLPQFSNFGGEIAPDVPFIANGDYWFKARCDGISTPGILAANADQDDDAKLFTVYEGDQLTRDQVVFTRPDNNNSAQLTILPEPTTMSLLAMGGLAFLNRRKNR